MAELLQLIVSGTAAGAIYALAALGFTLLWQASGTINFAQGDFVMVAAFVMLWFMPAAGILGAWLALKIGRRALAISCVTLPLGLLGLIFGWYYLAPPAYL